jgi:hypothetical protein
VFLSARLTKEVTVRIVHKSLPTLLGGKVVVGVFLDRKDMHNLCNALETDTGTGSKEVRSLFRDLLHNGGSDGHGRALYP